MIGFYQETSLIRFQVFFFPVIFQNVEEAKLNIFSKIDHPLSPSEKGTLYFATGIDKKIQQQYRERLFEVNKLNVQEVALKYLHKREDESIAIVGTDQNADQFKKDGKWQIIE